MAAFGRLRPRLTDGAWRLSRNYGLTHQDFKSRPSDLVRRLVPVDRPHIEKAAEAYEGARHHSTMRDFAAMAAGRPVRCWGAFTDGGLAGFVSTNPICAGVTEISWIFTAEAFRRRGIAAGLLTAACEEALGLGDMVGYHAGGTGDDLDRMVRSTGFIETLPTYRFIPASSKVQWLTHWGQHV
ncbi:MAG: GNAT family N-acetyltransferase [Armatimonadetes bacterium]|nr:GNAT family N-acetyltransferase [Armatimonadota bacterium]